MTPITAVIIVDHGSRRSESNLMLEAAVGRFAAESEYQIVEAAHMELAQPDISAAFNRCIARGARRVIVFPYFLSPGRHWTQDIPALVAAAAADHNGVEWMVTAPFGLHPGMTAIISDRIQNCLRSASIRSANADWETSSSDVASGVPGCDVCSAQSGCQFIRQ